MDRRTVWFAPMTSDLRRSTCDGQTFVHLDSGEGPLLVLLHGFPDTPRSWDGIRSRLNGAGYRTVAAYLRGYQPETVVEGRPYDARTTAIDAVRLLDSLGEERAVLIGHNWGASIVYAAAHLHPGRTRAVVAIAIPPARLLRPTPYLLFRTRHFLALRLPWAEAAVRRNDFAYLDTLYRRWAPNWSGPDREASLADVKACFRDPVALHGALAYYRAWSPIESRSLGGRVSVPGLVVGGTRDVIDAAAFRAAPSCFDARCEVLVVDGAGHWPHREAEDRFVERLLAFLGSL